MNKLNSILVVASRHDTDRSVFSKAVVLARSVGAKVHLFLCDSGPEAFLRLSSATRESEKAWAASALDRHGYLEALRASIGAPDLHVSLDSGCETAVYKGILRKIDELRPDLVMKSPSGAHPLQRFTLHSNDWRLLRACPVTLMLVHGREWHLPPRFGALVDLSEDQSPQLADAIVHTSEYFALGCRGELDVVYSEPAVGEASQLRRVAALERLTREYRVGAGHVHILQGDPEITLPQFARRQQYDALVLGALTHRKGISALMRTLSGVLVEAMGCDFIFVKSDTPWDDSIHLQVAES